MHKLYEMKLHRMLEINETMVVTRVPGGWLYNSYTEHTESLAFVPYNDEFKYADTDGEPFQ